MYEGREARVDASFSRISNAVDTASKDREVNRCDAGATFSQTGQRHICDLRVERRAEFHTTTGVSDLFSPFVLHRIEWETDLDQRVSHIRHGFERIHDGVQRVRRAWSWRNRARG